MIKKLTREEYKQKFNEQFNKYYQLEDGEQVQQCKEPYPPYWFISSKGRLFSVARNNIKQLKVNHSWSSTGQRHKWHFNYLKNGKRKIIEQQRLVAEHFLSKPQTDEKLEIHHKKKIDSFSTDEPYNANNKDNLQYVTKSEHEILTRISRTPLEKQDNEFVKSVFGSDLVLTVKNTMTMEEVQELINHLSAMSYIQNLTDDMKKKQVEILRPESETE